MKKAAKNIALFFIILCLCTSFLFLSTLLPQKPIDDNIAASMERLSFEGLYCKILDGKKSSTLDNFTDSLIIMVTKSSDYRSEPMSFLTNPIVSIDGVEEWDPLLNLENYVAGKVGTEGTYVRYWMGFKVFLRPLFSVFTYSQIRIVQLGLLLLLGLATLLSVWKNTNFMTAVMYGLSVLLIRPLVISRSFQFSCCLFIALLAVLALPYVKRRAESLNGFFMAVGMLTMFFDFYTVPVLTFGMPMVYCAAICAVSGDGVKVKDIIVAFIYWMAGYVGMWIAKLSLIEIITSEKGFSNGFAEFMHWMGPGKRVENQSSTLQALNEVRKVVFESTAINLVMALFVAIMLALLIVKACRRELSASALKKNMPVLFIAAFPIIWYCVAANPTKSHAFFQYRSIAATHWAAGAFVTLLPGGKKK